jgi:hypothetical protein
MNRNVKSNRVCEDWTVIFLQSVLDGWWGFLRFFPATVLIEKLLMEYRMGWVTSYLLIMRLTDFVDLLEDL